MSRLLSQHGTSRQAEGVSWRSALLQQGASDAEEKESTCSNSSIHQGYNSSLKTRADPSSRIRIGASSSWDAPITRRSLTSSTGTPSHDVIATVGLRTDLHHAHPGLQKQHQILDEAGGGFNMTPSVRAGYHHHHHTVPQQHHAVRESAVTRVGPGLTPVIGDPNMTPSLSSSCGGAVVGAMPMPCLRSQLVAHQPTHTNLLSWDVLLHIYRELVRLISRLPFKRRLVVCIVCRGSKIRLDLGQVRAAGVVCLLGLGLSLGTLLLYRLYFRLVVPFLQSVWRDQGQQGHLDHEYTLYLESDSEVDETMGNSNSKKTSIPSVYYSPSLGVSLGSRPPSLSVGDDDDDNTVDLSRDCAVRLRQPRQACRHKSPSPASDKDSAIGCQAGSEMSQSLYSENSANRDSFYSTAESGFEDFWSSYLPEEARSGFQGSSLGPASMRMLYRAHHGRDPGLNSLGRSTKPGLDTLSDVSSERSGVMSSRSQSSSTSQSNPVLTNVDPLMERLGMDTRPDSQQTVVSRGVEEEGDHSQTSGSLHRCGVQESSGVFTGPDLTSSPVPWSTQSSPYRNVRTRGGRGGRGQHSVHCQTPLSRPFREHIYDLDPAMDASESLCSFSSSLNEDIDWDEEESNRGPSMPNLLPEGFHPSVSDYEFRQSLMQRIHEWSAFAEEYNKSRAATPEPSPPRFVRRSRSLDRYSDSPLLDVPTEDAHETPAIQVEPTTERNLETLEYELHDIQGEFESITSRLHQLIHQGNAGPPHSPANKSSSSDTPQTPQSQQQQHSAEARHRHKLQVSGPRLLDRHMRTRWERVPSSACSTSSRSSRASSVEYVWDLADYHHANESSSGDSGGPHTAERVAMPTGPEVVNIRPSVPLSDYVEREWHSDSPRAKLLRQAYAQIPSRLACHRLSVVRGDNYCGLRSTLYQVLSLGQRVTQGWAGIIPVMDRLHDLYADPTVGLEGWTFANRLPGHCKDRLASMAKCALSLYATIEEVCNLPSREERQARTLSLLNSSATFDLELMEGLKVMMALTLVELERRAAEGGEPMPVFAQLLLCRDTSSTVGQFVENHLNTVGDSGGLEQVEMCLLAYTLGVRIRVLRLSQLNQPDFDCTFPDDVPTEWPEVCLVAEDDRHYNVPVP